MPHFMIELIPYINLLNLSWIKKMSILRNYYLLYENSEKKNIGIKESIDNLVSYTRADCSCQQKLYFVFKM